LPKPKRPNFFPSELSRLRPTEDLQPSEWARRFRHLSEFVSAEPGPWRNDRTPYLVELMDSVRGEAEEIVFCKAAQVGFSEATRNVLGYWIDQAPGPILMVMPSERATAEVVEERIKPLLQESPVLKSHVTHRQRDTNLSRIKLDSCSIYVGWAGSPQSLATRPIRYVVLDEVDKYPPFSGREADPVALAKKRTTTYAHRARTLIGSTPTTRSGNIWKAWEQCGDQRHFHVPCPKCKKYQRLLWPQVRWPKRGEKDRNAHADGIELHARAWYECQHCRAKITDANKPDMLDRGVWVGSDQVVGDDGEVQGPRVRTKRVGYHLSSLYSPWVTFSRMASEYLRAVGDAALMMDFRNSRLAEPFEDRVLATKTDEISEKAQRAPAPGVIPEWAQGLYTTADTQSDHFYWVTRAWGYEYRSQLIAWGICDDFDTLEKISLEQQYRTEQGGVATPSTLLIDSAGNRTNEVYEFAMRDEGRIIPIRGSSHPMRSPWSLTRIKNRNITLRVIDTEFYKDALVRLIRDKNTALWMPHNEVTDDYVQQMASEHKITDVKRKRQVWVPVSSGARNHVWDCEVYQAAAAYMAELGMMEPKQDDTSRESRSKPSAGDDRHERPPAESAGSNWATSHKGRW